MIDRDGLVTSLSDFARGMTETVDVTDALESLCTALTDVLGITGVGISVTDPDGNLRYATACNELITEIELVQEKAQAGPCYDAFSTGKPIVVPEIDQRPDWDEFRDAAGRLGLRSVAGVPITIRRDVLGAVNLYELGRRDWSPEDIDVATVFADMAAAYLVHTALEESRRLADQLQYALDSRVVIEQAKGVLAGEQGLTVDDAFDRLRSHARNNGVTLRATAERVVREGFRPPPRPE